MVEKIPPHCNVILMFGVFCAVCKPFGMINLGDYEVWLIELCSLFSLNISFFDLFLNLPFEPNPSSIWVLDLVITELSNMGRFLDNLD